MITVSFLSGELVQFSVDDFFPGATIYNLKRRICDWIEENNNDKDDKDDEKDEKNDYNYTNDENEIDLIHILDENDTILENNQVIDYNENNENTLYKVFINKYERRVVYTKEDGNVYYHFYGECPSDSDPQIDRQDMPILSETTTIKYLFDIVSFRECVFFRELGLDDEEDLYDPFSDNVWVSRPRRKTKRQLDYLSMDRLRSIFRKIKIRFV